MDIPLPTYEESIANEDPLVAVPKRPKTPPLTASSPTVSFPETTGTGFVSVRSGPFQNLFEPTGPPPEPDHDETRLERYHRLALFDEENMDKMEWYFESEPHYAVHCVSPVFDLWITINPDLKRKVDQIRVRYNSGKNDRLYVVVQDREPYLRVKQMIVDVTMGGRWRVNWLLYQMSTSVSPET